MFGTPVGAYCGGSSIRLSIAVAQQAPPLPSTAQRVRYAKLVPTSAALLVSIGVTVHNGLLVAHRRSVRLNRYASARRRFALQSALAQHVPCAASDARPFHRATAHRLDAH